MTDSPRALLIAPYFLPRNYGGAVQLYDGLIRRFRTIRVTVLTERQGAGVREAEEFDRLAPGERGYDVRRMDRMCFHLHRGRLILGILDGALFFTKARWFLRTCLAQVRPDVVICGGTYAAGWLLNAVPERVARVNYVLGEEITQDITGGPLSRYLRREQRRALRRADVNVALSQFTASALMQFAEVPGDRIHLQLGCIDTDRFQAAPDRHEHRAKWKWADRAVMLTVARLIARKGVDRVLHALALLRSQGRLQRDWLYAVAGRGPEEDRLRSLSRELGLDEHVRFLGFVADADLVSLYSAADVFVLANRDIHGDTEGFGLVFLEANACGLPVIGGVAGGTADAIVDNLTGLRVDVEDTDALADAIALLMGNPRRRNDMMLAGLERVRRSFSVAAAAASLEELLLRVIQQKRHAGSPSSVPPLQGPR